MWFGVVGEDRADAQALKTIITTICEQHSVPLTKVSVKGYSGWSEMFRKAAGQLQAFADQGCDCLIVCHDADGPDPEKRRAKVKREIFGKLTSNCSRYPLIPVYEIEAWFLADFDAVLKVFPTAKMGKPITSPERINNPKEKIKSLTRDPKTHKTRFQEGMHNEKIAPHLNPDTVARVCPEFKRFVDFIAGLSMQPKQSSMGL